MLRRSSRLQSDSHYSSDGEPVASYKETTYRVFKKRKSALHSRFQRNPEAQMDPDVHSETDPPVQQSRMFLLAVLFFCFGLFITLDFYSGKVFTESSEDAWKEVRHLREEVKQLKEKTKFLWPDEPNFALETQGARIIYERTTEPYTPEDPGRPPVSPRILLQDWAPVIPGQCWAFKGSKGHVSVQLSHSILVSHVAVGHILMNMSPDEDTTSAPRMFAVFGKQHLEDPDIHLGTFEYVKDGSPLQTFDIDADKRTVVKYVSVQICSNWGNPEYTCMYRLRVHGKLAVHV